MTRLVIVGGGRMGEALFAGLIESGWAPPEDLTVVEPLAARHAELEVAHPGIEVSADLVAAVDVVLAVKPGAVAALCGDLAGLQTERVLSIAAGISTTSMQTAFGRPVRVVRAMPNTPTLVGLGASAIAAGAHAGDADLAWAADILGSVGTVTTVPESTLDAVTGLSGSGPAYVYLVAEALIDAGVEAGLPRSTAEELVVQTIAGSAEMLRATGRHPAELRAQVTSPGGTTAAGVHELESGRLRGTIADAVLAATARSIELGRTDTNL